MNYRSSTQLTTFEKIIQANMLHFGLGCYIFFLHSFLAFSLISLSQKEPNNLFSLGKTFFITETNSSNFFWEYYYLFLYLITSQLYIKEMHNHNPDTILNLLVEKDHKMLRLQIRQIIGRVTVLCQLPSLKCRPTTSYGIPSNITVVCEG